YDPENDHQFFVDTTREPPRSIWHHPYDDDEYLATLDPTERQKIQGSLRVPSNADLAAETPPTNNATPTTETRSLKLGSEDEG
ncbi:MAG: hypothetical protein Q9198_006948, partial [Flavoplaca austrocitrina]